MKPSKNKFFHFSLPSTSSASSSSTTKRNSRERENKSLDYDGVANSPKSPTLIVSPLVPKSPSRSPTGKAKVKSPKFSTSPLYPSSPTSATCMSPQIPVPSMSPTSAQSTSTPSSSGPYFNFNRPFTKAMSQTEDPSSPLVSSPSYRRGAHKSVSGYKTLLTKTQSEPKSAITFEVNNRPYEIQQEKVRCNIHTNPGYLLHWNRNDSLESADTTTTIVTTTSTTLPSANSSDKINSNMSDSSAHREHCRRRRKRDTNKRYRKSTSDLSEDTTASIPTSSVSRPSSPRQRRGSMKGGLAYLASRRGSKDSTVSANNEEDIGPLNFQNNSRVRQRRTSNFLELPIPDHIRPRVLSLPEKAFNPRFNDDLYRLRTFSITNKGSVVNCGDSIISRRSRSNTSVNSTASRHSAVSNNGSPFEGASCCSGYYGANSSSGDSEDSLRSVSDDMDDIQRYRVVLLGDSGVGKTALVSQFMTSEYMNTYDASLDDEFGEKTVSILLDGEESEIIFIDHPTVEMSVENSLATYEPHACVVVYSIVAKDSFKVAEDILGYLWQENYTQEKSVIVVGNKADLARSRVISANDGKSLASSRNCKFIETSSGIQHNVDELLVGILKQIRLREARDRKKSQAGGGPSGSGTVASSSAKNRRKIHGSKTSLSLNIAREILQKMCLNDITKSKSCENLHVL